MALVLDATVGGVNSNSYDTLAEATALLQERLHTEPWFALGGIPAAEVAQAAPWLMLDGGDVRIAALLSATRLMEEQIAWYGAPATLTQALSCPRSGLVDRLGRAISSTVIPPDVKRAQAYYALALLRDITESASVLADAGIKSKKFADTTIVFQDTKRTPSPMQGLPAEIRQMLRCYGQMTGGIMVPLLRT